MLQRIRVWLFIGGMIFCAACTRAPENLEPTVNPIVREKYLHSLPSPFSPLTEEEKQTGWGHEYEIGMAFAHQLDLYQSITAFKRAEILIPPTLTERKMEIQYEILLCYYMGKKYKDVIYTFDHSTLTKADPTFPAFHDLLIILYDSYEQEHETLKADHMLKVIEQHYPNAKKRLVLSSILSQGKIEQVRAYAATDAEDAPQLSSFIASYEAQKKSPTKAKALNAIVPGAGYLYLGQKQSAVTALFLNGLFIAASAHFFHRGDIAAGIIFTSFEAGWYFGGIHGAGLEAKYYNERLYEKLATPMMNEKRLFPIFMLNYAF